MEFEPENRLGKNRSFLIVSGILAGIILLSVACLAVYAFTFLPRQSAQRMTQQETMIAQYLQVNQALTAKANIPTSTATPAPFFQYTIDMYGLNLKLPMGWTIQETNRRPEPSGDQSLAMGHDCADYIVANPEESARLAIYPPCEVSSGTFVACPTNSVSIAQSGSDGFFVRYFDDVRGAYFYTQASISGTPSPSGTNTLICSDKPSLMIGGVSIRVEFQYVGIESDKEDVLRIIDQIVLSLESR